MIHYDLRCAEGHEFDGWYKDSAAFDRLAQAGLLDCPVCGGTKVSRALMAPAVVSSRRKAAAPVPPGAVGPDAGGPPAPASPGARAAAGPMPAQLLSLLQRMRAEVERNCDYVGSDFAEEARRMHEGESQRRGIYGEATEAEAEALREDGIEIAQLPWVPKADG